MSNRVPGAYTGEETAVQAVVGSIAVAFRRLKKPRYREMSTRRQAFYSVCPQLFFFESITLVTRRYVKLIPQTGLLNWDRIENLTVYHF